MIESNFNIEVQIQVKSRVTIDVHPDFRCFAIFLNMSIKKLPSTKICLPPALLSFRRPW